LAAIVRNFELRAEFPPETLAAAQALPEEPSPEELAGRVDYTSPAAFTIDPEDAKDHDDAVAIRDGKDGGTQALVHIADVSFYVAEGSPVDLEARRRATSVYLPGLTFPMLPPRLSSDLCSLREGALRLTKTIALTFSRNARLVETRIERSYIRSAAFLTYEQVKQAVEEERPGPARSPEVYGALQRMRAFTQELRRRRLQAGALDLDLPETRLLLDEHGAVAGWEKQGHHWAHQLIEELMLAANRAVAEELAARGLPGMFRVHEEPDPKALRQFAEFVSEFGLTLRPPYDRVKLQRLLEKVRGRDHEEAVNFALLTSLKQARYSAECRPHYALAFTRYLHFTSPIRRYPDLVVHRALDGAFGPGAKSLPAERAQRSGGDDYYRQVARLRSLSDHCSRRERESDAAEEEAVKVRQLAFLRRNLRDCHEGVITRVREFGFFVELRDCRVEGLVRIQDLRDDHYEYLPQLHLLQGRRRGRTFRLGDKVQVRVLYVDQGRRQVGLGII
jgi:ribonuclease R